MSSAQTSFSVRIVVCDHYLAKPIPGIDVIYSEFRGSDIRQVPVLRIFGSASDGHKTCLHIHGVFPYFYIPCPNPNPQPQFLYQIAASLDKALNIALKQATSANQHVYKISLVKGLPFYGFHSKEHLYLKVFLYNPGLMKQAVDLCSNGAVLGQSFQPHESHLNFTLQFFIDFNLFGMSNIDLQTVIFRKKNGERNSQQSDDIIESLDIAKSESMCYYEADCIASHIINRQRVGRGDGIENPGLEEVWNQEKERRKQLNMSMASKSLSQGRLNDETDSHYKYDQMIKIKMSGLIEKPVASDVSYPAESMEGTQLCAVDVSMHLPDSNASFNTTLKPSLDESLADCTLVDENVALNCSLNVQYSQVLLDSEDLDLIGVLKDMEEDIVEQDSIMGTPDVPEQEPGEDPDDMEYSQVYNEDTLLFVSCESKNSAEDSSASWNDSFWDDVNIPQLDGTFDDDHVKKVRKRKMRPFQVGLARPRSKKKVGTEDDDSNQSQNNVSTNSTFIPPHNETSQERTSDQVVVKEEVNSTKELESSQVIFSQSLTSKESKKVKFLKEEKVSPIKEESSLDLSLTDEINESILSLRSVSKSLLKKKSKKAKENSQNSNISITELVQKYDELDASTRYDLKQNYQPEAGSSKSCKIAEVDNSQSSPESEDLGFISFYDTSKMFDVDDETISSSIEGTTKHETIDNSIEDVSKHESKLTDTDDDIKLRYSDTTPENNSNKFPAKILTPRFRPPTYNYVLSTLDKYNIHKTKNIKPYYSNHKDSGDKLELGQLLLKIQSNAAHDQKPFEKILDTTSIEEWRQLLFLQTNETEESKLENLKIVLAGNKVCVLEPIAKPPRTSDVLKWMENKDKCMEVVENERSEILEDDDLENSQAIGLNDDVIECSLSGDTGSKETTVANESLQITMQPDGSFLCFGGSEAQKEVSDTPVVEKNFLTLMALEVHTSVRGDLNPDPQIDPIQAVFITITNDCPTDHFLQKSLTEIIIVDNTSQYLVKCTFDSHVTYVDTEIELLEKVIELIRTHDPDIMCGYEIEMNSWGYILERSEVLNLDIIMEISRITEKYRQKRWRRDEKDYEGRIIGRILFNVWRLFRYELALSSYSFENCMHEILKERVPKYSYAQLSQWWNDESKIFRWIPVEYYLTKLSGTVRMLEKLDIINRTAELARLFGLQWWEVLSRGSQFRVESLMLRAARPLNLIALSPTVKQRAAMRAPECLPLIFEPQSRFYSDPVIVLDFQSLYPSMMIAYNYCFSTCIGRVQNINGDASYEFGAWRLRIPKAKLEALVQSGLVHWSPVGVGFVKSSVRKGVLPALLRRILAARQAVKKNMKFQTDEAVKKAMHSRQLGLKLIANVTYGYTAANFSGRMPCVEVGDSVVSKGRETLERAIKMVEDNKQWNAKVIYGDTDSMFVLIPGGTKQEAFKIGQEIADAVTADNPSPVALKLEKVYQPCILQTKKRYVGYMYESADQEVPVYEAKGIETVRRDGCPAGVKLLQRSLCELFATGDMSRVKRLVMTTLSRLVDGTMPLQELFFTREYNGPHGYRPGASAPPNEIAKRLVSRDRRASPRTGWRVSWLVTAGAPGVPLCKLARTPQEVVKDNSRPHLAYYVMRALLPPLHRCLSLLGADVFKWWNELGFVREIQVSAACTGGGIARYLWRERCALCGLRSTRSICNACAARPRIAIASIAHRTSKATTHVLYCRQICASCCGHHQTIPCENTECAVLWRRQNAHQVHVQLQEIVRQMPSQLTCIQSIDF